MSELYLNGLAAFLLLTVVVGMIRVTWGPTPADRMLAAMLFGTTGVAILLLLAEGMRLSYLRDVALVFALLAAVTAITFVQRVWRAGRADAAGRGPEDRAGDLPS